MNKADGNWGSVKQKKEELSEMWRQKEKPSEMLLEEEQGSRIQFTMQGKGTHNKSRSAKG
jgi:hypothetical protein